MKLHNEQPPLLSLHILCKVCPAAILYGNYYYLVCLRLTVPTMQLAIGYMYNLHCHAVHSARAQEARPYGRLMQQPFPRSHNIHPPLDPA